MKDTCVEGDYSPEKFKVLCNFIDVTKVLEPKDISQDKQDYYVYLGRMNEVKGVRTLCKVAAQLDKKLIVIGNGELSEELRTKSEESGANSSLKDRCCGRNLCLYCVGHG